MMNKIFIKLFTIATICIFAILPYGYANTGKNNFFSSGNITIKIPFSNEENIRNSAIIKAEKIGFQQMSKLLLSSNGYQSLLLLIDDLDISYFVESVEFIDEKITTDLYSAVFNINFSPFRVREYYDSQSLLYSEINSKNIETYVAFSNSDQFFMLFNMWNTEWRKVNNVSEKLLININTFSSSEMKEISVSKFLEGEFSKNTKFQSTEDYILIWCTPSYIKNDEMIFDIIVKIEIDNEIKVINKTFNEYYNLYRKDIFNNIISEIKNDLLNVWIESTSAEDEKYQYKFKFSVDDLNQWVKLKENFEKIELLKSYYLTSFDVNEVNGIIIFAGDRNKFKLVLSQQDMRLVDFGPYYKISIND